MQLHQGCNPNCELANSTASQCEPRSYYSKEFQPHSEEIFNHHFQTLFTQCNSDPMQQREPYHRIVLRCDDALHGVMISRRAPAQCGQIAPGRGGRLSDLDRSRGIPPSFLLSSLTKLSFSLSDLAALPTIRHLSQQHKAVRTRHYKQSNKAY